MKDKMINKVHLEGKIYDHDLEKKVTGETSKNPGTEYIRGKISIATDDDVNNIVDVYYTYVVEFTSKGSKNSTYDFLNGLLNSNYNTVVSNGEELATKVKIDTSIALNDFYVNDDELVSQMRNEGGFIHVTPALSDIRNEFNLDIVLTRAFRQDEDEERGLPERMDLEGYIFNFRKDAMPVKLTVYNPQGMDYFDGLDISGKNPTFTRVKGKEVTQVTRKEAVTEGAFGNDEVVYLESSKKIFLVDWTMKEPYEWDDTDYIAAIELKELLANREVMLAERLADYRNRKNGGSPKKQNTKSEDIFFNDSNDDYEF